MTQIEEQNEGKRSRRVYKTRWERAKRKRLREGRVQRVQLDIPRSLAKRLHAWTPKGVGFTNFLLRVLSSRNRRKTAVGVCGGLLATCGRQIVVGIAVGRRACAGSDAAAGDCAQLAVSVWQWS